MNTRKTIIKKNKMQDYEYLKTISIGLYEGNEITILNTTPLKDYTIIQVYKKIFAIPIRQMKLLELEL